SAKPLISIRLSEKGPRGNATLEETLTLISDDTQSVADKTLKLEAQFDQNRATFESRITAIANASSASVQELRRLTAIVGEASSQIVRFDEVIATQEKALTRTTVELRASLKDAKASISE